MEEHADASRRAARAVRRHHGHMLLIALAVLALSFVLAARPDGRVALPGVGVLPELCLLKACAGIDCPGCGMTRAFIALAHLRMHDAVLLNPVAPVLFLLVLLQVPYRLTVLRSERFVATVASSPWIEWPGRAVIAALLVLGVWRVLPV